jgi:hypothetical protein
MQWRRLPKREIPNPMGPDSLEEDELDDEPTSPTDSERTLEKVCLPKIKTKSQPVFL